VPEKSRKPILVIDFDGVIHSYTSKWVDAETIPDPPVPGALDFLKRAVFHFRVHILSSRSTQKGGIAAMQRWLISHLTETEDDIQAATEFVFYDLRWPIYKPPAYMTIDDRAFRFEGTWPDPIDLLNFKPWNKRIQDAAEHD